MGDQSKNGNGHPRRGFAAMDPERQREIARQGGRAAHQQGTAHEFSADEAREAGRRGGATISQDREHMAQIGRLGGTTISQNHQRMAVIGRLGGLRSARQRSNGHAPNGDSAAPPAPGTKGDGAFGPATLDT